VYDNASDNPKEQHHPKKSTANPQPCPSSYRIQGLDEITGGGLPAAGLPWYAAARAPARLS